MATFSVKSQVKDYNSITELRAVLKKLIDSEEKYTKDGLLLLIKIHRRMTLLAFKQMQDPDTDEPWDNWKTGKEQQQKWRAHSTGKSKKLLERTGKLKASALSASTKGKAQFKQDGEGRWTATLTLKTPEYAATHQFGASVISGKPRVYTNTQSRDRLVIFDRKATIPARPYWPFTRSYMNPKAKGEIDDALKAVFTAYKNSIYKRALEYVKATEDDGFTTSVGFSMPTTSIAKIHTTRLPIKEHNAAIHRGREAENKKNRHPARMHIRTRVTTDEHGTSTVSPGRVRVLTGAFRMPHGTGENFSYTPTGEAGRKRTKRTGIRGYHRDLKAEGALHERMGGRFPKTVKPRNPNSRYQMRKARKPLLEALRSQEAASYGAVTGRGLRNAATIFSGVMVEHYLEIRPSLVSRTATAEKYARDTNTPAAHEAARVERQRLLDFDTAFAIRGGVPGGHMHEPLQKVANAENYLNNSAQSRVDDAEENLEAGRKRQRGQEELLEQLHQRIADLSNQVKVRVGPAAETARKSLERVQGALPQAKKNIVAAKREVSGLEKNLEEAQTHFKEAKKTLALARKEAFLVVQPSIRGIIRKVVAKGTSFEHVKIAAKNLEKDLLERKIVNTTLSEFFQDVKNVAERDYALQNKAGYKRGDTGGRPEGSRKPSLLEQQASIPVPGETPEEYVKRQESARKKARYQEEKARTAHQEAVRQLPYRLELERNAEQQVRIKAALAEVVTAHPFAPSETEDLYAYGDKFKETMAGLPVHTEEAVVKNLYRKSSIAESDTRAEGLLEGATRAFTAGQIDEAAMEIHRKYFAQFMERRIEGPERKAKVTAEFQAAKEEILRRRQRKPGETDEDYATRMDELQAEIDGLTKVHKRMRVKAKLAARKALTPAQKDQKKAQKAKYEADLKEKEPAKYEKLMEKRRVGNRRRKARADAKKKAARDANGGVEPPRKPRGPRAPRPKKAKATNPAASSSDFRTRRPRRVKPESETGKSGAKAGAAYEPKSRTEKEFKAQRDVYGKLVSSIKPPLTKKAKEHNEKVRQMKAASERASVELYQNQVALKVLSDELARTARSEAETAPFRALADNLHAANLELVKIRDQKIPSLSYRRVTRKTGNYSIRISTSARPSPKPRIKLTAEYKERNAGPSDTTQYTPSTYPHRLEGASRFRIPSRIRGREDYPRTRQALATNPRTRYNVRTQKRPSRTDS